MFAVYRSTSSPALIPSQLLPYCSPSVASVMQDCALCDKTVASAPVTCPRCKKPCYCSTDCERSHRAYHIFDCDVKVPIDSVYYLARACYADEIPTHTQTRVDYGFERAFHTYGRYGECMLCGLYRGLLIYSKIDLDDQDLARWRVEGCLMEHINATFAKLPRGYRGGYYAWFLENQHILDRSLPSTKNAQTLATNKRLHAAWVFIGRHKRKDTIEKIRSGVAKFSPLENTCFSLYANLLSNWRYGPSMEGWLTFGFVATTSEASETQLHRAYRDLIGRCSFAAFCQAYTTRTIPALFELHGISVPDSHYFYDIMSYTGGVRSSWFLKQYVEQKAGSVPGSIPTIPIVVVYDYGYINCKVAEEVRMLDQLYAALFRKPGVDPIALFEACLKDNVLGYVTQIVDAVDLLGGDLSEYARLLKMSPPTASEPNGVVKAVSLSSGRLLRSGGWLVLLMSVIVLSLAVLLFRRDA